MAPGIGGRIGVSGRVSAVPQPDVSLDAGVGRSRGDGGVDLGCGSRRGESGWTRIEGPARMPARRGALGLREGVGELCAVFCCGRAWPEGEGSGGL